MADLRDDMMEEKDLDEDIKQKEALIEQAKAIEVSSDWNAVNREIADLRRKWKKISYWESAYEEKLEQEFEEAIHVFYAKRNEIFETAQASKKELIEKAKVLLKADNMNKATEEMEELMRQWKSIGSAGKEEETLWAAFNEVRQSFYEKRRKFWEERRSQFDQARKTKEELIEQAAALADSVEWQKTNERFKTMMDQWKAAGSAGKDHEDRLWSAFNEHRRKFFDRRGEHYKELHEARKESYIAKKNLIDEARAVVEENEINKENTDKMKQLSAEWKKAGNCGKDKEDLVWNEFKELLDTYFSGLKEINEQKHQQWRQRMMTTLQRKEDLLNNQKRQLKRMQSQFDSLLSQREADELQLDIEDKEAFIAELEKQAEDIKKALEE